uniref:RNA-dependent RNA polymerase n=1 Tax=Racomitrium varium deltapartitivirus TaxID=2933094 RepID=A0A9C7LLS5_9VIRU|nr:RNA-dependent RNA polymerase [Racomitrium varium deltapartitivirus]CAI5383895.1 RNA-dependent RNA polymerase [Racomitrium varium deltapartitivirus]
MTIYNLDHLPTRVPREEFLQLEDQFVCDALRLLGPRRLQHDLASYSSSYYTLEGHLASLECYNRPVIDAPNTAAWNTTKQHVQGIFRSFGKCDATSYWSFDSVKWESSSAAGYGYTGQKGENENYHKAKTIAAKCAFNVLEGKSFDELINSTPDVAFVRTQLSYLPIKQKIRNVWGEAFHYIILEGLYACPLIEYFKENDTFYFLGADPLLEVPLKIQERVSGSTAVYMIDWSEFDATCQPWEIYFAFSLLKSMLRFPPEEGGQLFDFLVELFIFRKVLKPDGTLVLKDIGIPSGSYFTNLIGSIINYTRIQFIWFSLSGEFVNTTVQGDDSITSVSNTQVIHPIDMTRLAQPLGWKLTWEKCKIGYINDDVTFLSRTVRGYQMYRTELDLIRRACYPEYPNEDPTISTLRVYSLWRDGGMESDILFNVYEYLSNKYGCAQALPREHNLVRF